MKKILGEYVKTKRLKLGISQLKLSQDSHVSMASITRLETGDSNISVNNLIAILKVVAPDEMDKLTEILTRNTEADIKTKRVSWTRNKGNSFSV
jgi:transcriptional regulator with XRE-family HTH domain